MYRISNFTDNDDVKVIDQKGPFAIAEWQRDLSVMPRGAVTAYYSSKMNLRKRQLLCNVSVASVTVQPGAMQW